MVTKVIVSAFWGGIDIASTSWHSNGWRHETLFILFYSILCPIYYVSCIATILRLYRFIPTRILFRSKCNFLLSWLDHMIGGLKSSWWSENVAGYQSQPPSHEWLWGRRDLLWLQTSTAIINVKTTTYYPIFIDILHSHVHFNFSESIGIHSASQKPTNETKKTHKTSAISVCVRSFVGCTGVSHKHGSNHGRQWVCSVCCQ